MNDEMILQHLQDWDPDEAFFRKPLCQKLYYLIPKPEKWAAETIILLLNNERPAATLTLIENTRKTASLLI